MGRNEINHSIIDVGVFWRNGSIFICLLILYSRCYRPQVLGFFLFFVCFFAKTHDYMFGKSENHHLSSVLECTMGILGRERASVFNLLLKNSDNMPLIDGEVYAICASAVVSPLTQ